MSERLARILQKIAGDDPIYADSPEERKWLASRQALVNKPEYQQLLAANKRYSELRDRQGGLSDKDWEALKNVVDDMHRLERAHKLEEAVRDYYKGGGLVGLAARKYADKVRRRTRANKRMWQRVTGTAETPENMPKQAGFPAANPSRVSTVTQPTRQMNPQPMQQHVQQQAPAANNFIAGNDSPVDNMKKRLAERRRMLQS